MAVYFPRLLIYFDEIRHLFMHKRCVISVPYLAKNKCVKIYIYCTESKVNWSCACYTVINISQRMRRKAYQHRPHGYLFFLRKYHIFLRYDHIMS